MTIQCDKCGGDLTVTDAGADSAGRAGAGLPAFPSLRVRCRHCKQITSVRREAAPSIGPARRSSPPLAASGTVSSSPRRAVPSPEMASPTTVAGSPWSAPSAYPAVPSRRPRGDEQTIPLDLSDPDLGATLTAVGRRALASVSGTFEAVAAAFQPPRTAHAAARAAARAVDASALIDVRTMAEQTLAARSAREREPSGLFVGSALFRSLLHPPIEPVMMVPADARRGPPGWLWAAVGGSVAAICGTVVFAALLWHYATQAQRASLHSLTHLPRLFEVVVPGRSDGRGGPAAGGPVLAGAVALAPSPIAAATPAPASPAVAPVAVAPTAGAAGAAVLAAAANPGAPAGAQPAAPASSEAQAVATRPSSRHRSKHGGRLRGGKLFASRAVASGVPSRAPAAAAAKGGRSGHLSARPSGRLSSEDRELLALLDSTRAAARPAQAAPRPAPAAASALSSLPQRPDRSDVSTGLRSAQPGINSCFEHYQVPGTAHVRIIIGGSGLVEAADVSGPLAGTPTGECVARAVKRIRFKPFRDPTYSLTFPYILR